MHTNLASHIISSVYDRKYKAGVTEMCSERANTTTAFFKHKLFSL